MPVERRGWVTHGVCWVNGRPEELSCLAGRRQPSLSGTSRMRRESHVRICERLGVKVPGPTRRQSAHPHAFFLGRGDPHTARAALTGLRHRGYDVRLERGETGRASVYRAVTTLAASA